MFVEQLWLHWFSQQYFCLDTPGIPDGYHIIVGPNLNPIHLPFALLGLDPKVLEKAALSLGADATVLEKDIADVKKFMEELVMVSFSHPVTSPKTPLATMFNVKSSISNILESQKPLQGVSRFQYFFLLGLFFKQRCN